MTESSTTGSGDGSESPRKRRGVSFYVKVVASIITFLATVTGTYLALKGQPKPFTSVAWARQAEAVCQRDGGDTVVSLSDAMVAITNLNNGLSVAERDAVVHDMGGVAAGFDNLLGDLRALPTPADRSSDVAALLTDGDAVLGNLTTIFSDLSTVLAGTPDTQGRDMQAVGIELSNALHAATSTTIPAFTKQATALNLPHCELSGISTGTNSSRPDAPASLTYGEQQLVNGISPNDLSGCIGHPDLENSWVVAAVECGAHAAGPTYPVLVVRFANAPAEHQWFVYYTHGAVNNNDCVGAQFVGPWSHYGSQAGYQACYKTTSGVFEMVWTIDNALVGVIAYGSDAETVVTWWQNWGYVLAVS